MKIMTYNIQHGIDHLHRLYTKEVVVDLNKISQIIKEEDPDIIGLNEVYDAPVPFLETQAKEIGSKIGYYSYFGKAISIKGGYYGNALLSKYPFENIELIQIPDPEVKDEEVYYESRSMIHAEIRIDNKIYNVFVSHFGLASSEQKNATKTLIENISNLKNVIFMGDLNMEPDNDNIKEIRKYLNTLNLENKSFPSHNPNIRIDYIFASKDIKIVDSNAKNIVFSDHLPIYAIIE